MAFSTISTVVTDQSVDRTILESAMSLARRLDAHLDVYALAVDETRYEPMPAGSAVVLMQDAVNDTRARAQELADWAGGLLPGGDIKFGIEPVVLAHLGLDSGLGGLLRYSDLVLAPQPYGESVGPLQVQLLEAALFQRGVPCLVLPADAPMTEPPRRIAIAWDGSTEAQSAVRQALPFLKEAELVCVVMVDPPEHSPDRSDPGGGIAQMLARHGIHVQVSIVSRTMPRISDCLLRFVREHDIDLVVMGAYGHSRIREALIGGPTRSMLHDAHVPILMAH